MRSPMPLLLGAGIGTLALFAAFAGRRTAPATPRFLWPVRGYTHLSSAFGPRIDPMTHEHHHHAGIDIPVPIGTPVLAPAAGEIGRVDVDCGDGERCPNGNAVFLLADPYLFCFLHLSHAAVHRNQIVTRGQLLGFSGTSGRSTGPHLHLQVYQAGVPGGIIDPAGLPYE